MAPFLCLMSLSVLLDEIVRTELYIRPGRFNVVGQNCD